MTIEYVINDLMNFFGYKMTDQRRNFYHEAFREYPIAVVQYAVGECKNKSQRFPTVNELLRFVLEQKRIAWERAKRNEPMGLPDSKEADSEYAFEGWNLIDNASDRLISRGQLLARMRIMDVAYPGREWKAKADELQAFYEKHGFEIDDLPRRRANKPVEG